MRNLGFTLIELLVVLVIIGIISSFAVLAVRGTSPEQAADEELRRIANLMQLVSEQAVLEGREYGILFTREGYTFLRYQDLAWRPVEDDKLLRPRRFERGLAPLLVVERVAVPLAQTVGRRPQPQLLLYSSGERTPFQLTLAPPDEPPKKRLRGGLLDELTIEATAAA